MTAKLIKKSDSPIVAKDALASGGIVSGLAAFVGASCCVLPLILMNIGLGGAWIANLAFFAVYKTYFVAASAVLVALAFVAAFWGGRRPSRKTLTVLGVASVLTVAAFILPWYEGRIIQMLFR